MALDILTEPDRNLAFVLSEATGNRSRDTGTIASGAGVLEPGTVLGQLTADDKYTPSTDTGSNGAETAVAILAYRVDATSEDVTDAVLITSDAEVKVGMLAYDATVDDQAKIDAKLEELRAVGIKAR